MANTYYIMRKNDIVTMASIDGSGQMIRVAKEIEQDIAPIQYRYTSDWIKSWWKERAVPLSRDNLLELLRAQGYDGPSQYLVKNLGLSLTDYYWIKPVDSDLTWEKVNLFDNDFKSNLTLPQHTESLDPEIPHYSPNGSLQGDIEKTWAIINGKRCLVKGNRSYLSQESINETIAAAIHKAQDYDNYTEYKLIRINGRDYNYGCYSKAFTSQCRELVPAYAIYSSEKRSNATSRYEHFILLCKKNGMDIDVLQNDMDYQILTDFIMSEYDRHLNNIGVLRDADTLKLTRMAPIFDSGGCMFANKEIPRTVKTLLNIKTTGFTEREVSMLKYVKDRNAISLDKLPPSSFIKEQYEKDDKMREDDIKMICSLYERKIDILNDWQHGIDPLKKKYGNI